MRTTTIRALLLGLLATVAACRKAPPLDDNDIPSLRGRAHVIRDVPVRPGAIVVDTTGTPDAERETLRTPEEFAVVTDYYRKELPLLGYTILNQHGDSATLDLYSRRGRRDLWMHFERRQPGTEWTVLGTAAPVPDSSRLRKVVPQMP